MAEQQVHSLADLLDVLEGAGEGKGVASVTDIHESLGVRSFGPLLLAAGLIGLTPIGDIPVVPTVLAIIVVLISGQLLIGLRGFWLPGFIRRRSVKRETLGKAIRFVRPVARGVDRVLRPRMSWLTEGLFTYSGERRNAGAWARGERGPGMALIGSGGKGSLRLAP